MKLTALVFSGLNGSKSCLKDFADAHQEICRTFAQADEVVPGLSKMMLWESEKLREPEYALPALITTGMAFVHFLEGAQPDFSSEFLAGHSLGQYTAFCAAGSIDFQETLRLLNNIGRTIQEDSTLRNGAMISVLEKRKDVSPEDFNAAAEKIANQAGCVIANYNIGRSVVYSGVKSAVEEAGAKAKEYKWGVKPVHTTFPAHSPLMQDVAVVIRKEVEKLDIKPPKVPVISNGRPAVSVTDPAEIAALIVHDITAPVYWTDAVKHMIGRGVERFVECGPNGVLTAFHDHDYGDKPDQKTEAFSLATPEGRHRVCANGHGPHP